MGRFSTVVFGTSLALLPAGCGGRALAGKSESTQSGAGGRGAITSGGSSTTGVNGEPSAAKYYALRVK